VDQRKQLANLASIFAEWLALMIRIRDVPGSNLGPETGYPEVLCSCPETPRQMSEIET
jgi:hypothetical protein